jgi:hypothetical protein
MVRFRRNRGERPRKDEVICRGVVKFDGPRDEVRVNDKEIQREIHKLMKDQEPGRYKVQVRRRVVRQ